MPEGSVTNSVKPYLIIAVSAVFLLSLWFASDLINMQSTATPVDSCDLQQQSCTVRVGDHRLTLDIQPRKIQSLTPLTYTVEISGPDTEQVMIDLQGADMYMGINQTLLEPVADKPGLYTGSGELGVCTTGEMLWRAIVVANTESGPVRAGFEFRAK